MSVDKNLWVIIIDGNFILKSEVDNVVKLPKDWIDDKTKKVHVILNKICNR